MSLTSDLRISLDGSMALESNVSQHSGRRGSFIQFRDVVTDVAQRIVKREGIGPTLGSVAGTEIQTLHEYVYTDAATGVTASYALGAIDGGSYIYVSVNSGATWIGQTLPITPTAGGRWFFCNADNRVFAMNGKDATLVAIQTSANTLTWKKAGQPAPTVAPTYSLSTNDPPYNTGTVSVTEGSPTVTGVGTTWVTGATWVGKTIKINAIPYTILSVTGTTTLTLTENFREPTNSYAYNIYRGVGDWLTGPRYCYSFYNPTTGHSSNVSPVLQITEQNAFGRTITVTIAGSGSPSGENYLAYQNGYTQIQLFRSAKNAFTLVALNEKLTNNNSGAAIVYVETALKFADTYLTDILAPFDSNGVPPVLTCMAFYLDRAWGLTLDGRLRVTPAPFELSFGVAVESWPVLSQFALRPPLATGLLVMGTASDTESLVIQTANGDRALAGTSPINFYHYKMRSRKSGSLLYSAQDMDGNLISFYRDKRLMSYPGAGDLGIAIQDKLSLVRNSLLSKVRLHWFAAQQRNLLLLSVPSAAASTVNDYTYVFDLDKLGSVGPAAYEWNVGFSAFATVHDSTTGELQLWGGTPSGAVYRLLGTSNQDTGSNFTPIIKTCIIRPGDYETWSETVYIHMWVNDASATWTGRIYIHEQTSSGATDGTVTPITFEVAPYKSQSAQGRLLRATWTHTKRLRTEAMQLEVTFPTGNAPYWIEKIIIGEKAAEERGG